MRLRWEFGGAKEAMVFRNTPERKLQRKRERGSESTRTEEIPLVEFEFMHACKKTIAGQEKNQEARG